MLGGLKKILFWTYPRGSWQYDLAVAAILAFIFLTPRSVFDGSAFQRSPAEPLKEQKEVEAQQTDPEKPSTEARSKALAGTADDADSQQPAR